MRSATFMKDAEGRIYFILLRDGVVVNTLRCMPFVLLIADRLKGVQEWVSLT